jgi:hypothetical protein
MPERSELDGALASQGGDEARISGFRPGQVLGDCLRPRVAGLGHQPVEPGHDAGRDALVPEDGGLALESMREHPAPDVTADGLG